MMFLKVWVSPKHCLIHQELEIPCQGRKRERFFQGVKRFQIKFLESNILCGGINCLPTNIYGAAILCHIRCEGQGRHVPVS